LENKKTAFIIAGPNDSGKTTFLISLIKNTTILTGTHLNADIVGNIIPPSQRQTKANTDKSDNNSQLFFLNSLI